MKLQELIHSFYPQEIPPKFKDLEIDSISCDSRNIHPRSLFVALQGTCSDGAEFIPQAVRQGAVAVVRSGPAPAGNTQPAHICTLYVSDPKDFLRKLLQKFYGNLSADIRVVGITGTNGKTTISYLLESIFRAAGSRCGLIGTINYRIGDKIIPSKNTTPGIVENQSLLAELIAEKAEYCVMEVSSHALEQGRVDLIDFKAAVFTNLTAEHLDYHADMDGYFKAKSLLFSALPAGSTAVINADDAYGKKLKSLTKAKILWYGSGGTADIRAENLKLNFSGSTFTVKLPKGEFTVKTNLIGRHNVYNILASAGVAFSQGLPPEIIKKGVESLTVIPGRLERVDCGQDFSVFVDYAHTDDALSNVLKSLKEVCRSKIFLVFGCGGNRDRLKRPKMGKVADSLADWSILTSDNPRNENPDDILREISTGFVKKNYETISDRKEAIHKALSLAKAGDVVLIAGKGHEDYQIFKDQRIHFDDREVVQNYFAQKVRAN